MSLPYLLPNKTMNPGRSL